MSDLLGRNGRSGRFFRRLAGRGTFRFLSRSFTSLVSVLASRLFVFGGLALVFYLLFVAISEYFLEAFTFVGNCLGSASRAFLAGWRAGSVTTLSSLATALHGHLNVINLSRIGQAETDMDIYHYDGYLNAQWGSTPEEVATQLQLVRSQWVRLEDDQLAALFTD